MSLAEMAERIGRKLLDRPFPGSIKFDCGADGVIVLAEGTASTADRKTDCTLLISQENLVRLLSGRMNPMIGMATGKLKLSGDPMVAMRFAKLIG